MPSPSWPKLPPGALTRFQTSAQGGRARLSLRLPGRQSAAALCVVSRHRPSEGRANRLGDASVQPVFKRLHRGKDVVVQGKLRIDFGLRGVLLLD
jgi:hypothetical protein